MNFAMIRIALLGSRSAWGRLLGVAAGIATGVALFVTLLGAYQGLDRREDRSGWMNLGYGIERTGDLEPDQALVAEVPDYVRDDQFRHITIAVGPNSTVQVPHLAQIPGPGEYLASPAMQKLIDSLPADQLGDRFGTSIGTLPDATLESPDSLVILSGGTPEALSNDSQARLVSDFSPVYSATLLAHRIVIVIGAIGMYFPVLLFISIATQLGAVQRRDRFAALRLIGASPRIVSGFAAIETAVTATIGAIAGVISAYLVRPVVLKMPVRGERFYSHDLAVSPTLIVVTMLVMIVAATVVAGMKAGRTSLQPGNSSRDHRERRPSALRLFPVLLGFAIILGVTLAVRRNAVAEEMLWAYVFGFAVTMLGIVAIGPWLTLALSSLLYRLSRSAAPLIAGRRISSAPEATFRAVSGLVVTIFVITVFAGSAGAIAGDTKIVDRPGLLPSDAISVSLYRPISDRQIVDLKAVPGVTAIAIGSYDRTSSEGGMILTADGARALGFIDVPDAEYVKVDGDLFFDLGNSDYTASLIPLIDFDPAVLQAETLYVRTDGSGAAIDRARTAIELTGVSDFTASSRAQLIDRDSKQMVKELKVLAFLGALVSIGIAGASLAIATACTMLERQRVIGLMRLMGMPRGSLRRIVALETALPLIAVLALAVVLGFAAAWCIIDGTSSHTVGRPDRWYALSIAAGLVMVGAMISVTFGLVSRNTQVTATRYE
jgi:ABC-type antimicrobial peptide transport system permease subunit